MNTAETLSLYNETEQLKSCLGETRTLLMNQSIAFNKCASQVQELTAKLDASLQAYALLASHRDRLADACQALQVVAVKCEYFGRGEPYHHLIEQARLALGGDK